MRFRGSTPSAEERWAVFDDAYTRCLQASAEMARYEWHWQQRTQWLAEHSDERDTTLWQERREKRQQMVPRFIETRTCFLDAARIVQACALYLGDDARDRLRDEYGLDFTRTGDTLDVFLRQWAAHLTFNPEPVPF